MSILTDTLASARTIAVVGFSPDPSRTSYAIGHYLIEAGFTVIPINPNESTIEGMTSYPDLQSVPDTVHIDIVNVFRKPKYAADVVRDTLARIVRTGEKPAIWTQIGVSSQEAEKLATEAGLVYIANRCIMVEHARGK
ncbi:MAG: CoA-binding protein [Rhodothermales bacterium]|nr:CoA-binding protein [Rhodothermales bacterium]